MYDQQVGEWREQLKEDVNDYGNIKNFLGQMQSPYGFLDFKAEREKGFGMSYENIDQEQNEKIKFKKKFKRFHDFEKKVVDQYVDVYAN